MIRITWLVLVIVLILFCAEDVNGRRGRARGRTKSRVMLFMKKKFVQIIVGKRINVDFCFIRFGLDANWFTYHRQIQRSGIRPVL